MPLLAGWNADEVRERRRARQAEADRAELLRRDAQALRPGRRRHPEGLPGHQRAEALESAASLASDMFIGYGTWKWIEMHARTGAAPVYRYSFDRKIPVPADEKVNGMPATSRDIGARHAGEIEYVFGTLDSRKGVPWEPVDRTLSDAMTSYWAAFARTGDPSVRDCRPAKYSGAKGQVLHLDDMIRAAPEAERGRYEALEIYMSRPR